MSRALMAGGIFFLLSGPLSAACYYSKIYREIQSFSYAALVILILATTISILFDETVGNAIAVKPTDVRGGAILCLTCLISTVTIFAFALHRIIALYWLGGLAVVLVLVGFLMVYWLGRGNGE
ncbi:hypothetical protein PN499_23175 [Kamptonema animale CS-326]|jgi:hypothetical protein|uniref:hypothetical protein n=1 Tax=Kamptonema animale TaxID=92934 RepID=UPI00232C6B46|nr:hypothetical protein [Kamptonema animale]MDB9514107.1 hypothetical protein [Kamptonema animale CS-326]